MPYALVALLLLIQPLPPPFPRDGANKVFENEQVIIWDVSWAKGEPTPLHEHRFASLAVTVQPGRVKSYLADGTTRVEGASELRVKESDRLTAIIEGLDALGADVAAIPDGFVVKGGRQLSPASLATYGDHRMVMAWAIASLGVDGDCTIDHLDQVKISYPGFWETLDYLAR